MLDFNDLFNDFFNKRNKNVNPLHDELRKLMETIASFKAIDNEQKLEQEIDKELGKPTQIEELTNDGVHYKKLTWLTPHGKFVKIIVTDAEEEVKPRVKTKSLEEQLKEAVEAENYELAIELRDKIKAANKPRKTRKKKTDE
jgi:excinuclease UvrABC helicase subunit UvrB